MKNHEAIIQEENINIDSNNLNALIQRIERLEQKGTGLAESPSQDIEDRLAMVVFSGDLDKAIAAFIIASGAAALGLEVSIFFTFWGINIIKKERHFGDKNLLEKGFTALMPGNTENLPISQMNYFGIGSKLIRRVMKDKGTSSLEELIETAQELRVRLVSCKMSQELLGISKSELMEGTEDGDVASFLGDASRAKATLFI